MENILRTVLYEWLERKLPETIEREQKINFNETKFVKKALVITGFRRVGKTYFLFHHIKKLLEKYSRKEVIYINFEDERLPQEKNLLSSFLPTVQSIFGQKPKYLFLDEIQNIPFWSKWLRRILDTEDIKIYLTGSSSRVSSFELPSELHGRSLEITIYPLNLKEFFHFKNVTIDKEKIQYLDEEKARFNFLFDEYLSWGGLPEIVLLPLEKKQEVLQSYFETVIKKEIADRFKIKNNFALKTMLKLLLNSTYITVTKLYNNLKTLGIKIGKTTVNQYLSYIESSYFLKQLYCFSPSIINQLQYPRKLYFIDNGFITSLSTKFSKNLGRLFENFVFWQLNLKEKGNLYYYNDSKNEVDFVILKEEKPKMLYQVCYDLSDFETKERELKSLEKARKKLRCQNNFLVVRNIDNLPKNLINYQIKTPLDFF